MLGIILEYQKEKSKTVSLFRMLLISGAVLSLLVALLPHLVWCVWRLLALSGVCARPVYAPFGWTTLALVCALWLVMLYGYFVGRFQLQVVPTTYQNATLPVSFDGYKIVQISDLHLSTFDDRPQALQRVVDSVNAQHPDLICFTGDLVTIGVAEAAPYGAILRQLQATDGVVSVLGNHDFMIYTSLTPAEQAAEVERLVAFQQQELGWTVLRNAHHILTRNTDTLTIVGVDNSSCGSEGFRTIHRGDLPKALAGTDGFRVLLSHDPTHWRAEVVPQTDIPLTLSGHTHSGQIRLFGIPLSRVSFRENAGWYSTPPRTTPEHRTTPEPTQEVQTTPTPESLSSPIQQSLYVNSGIGCTLPIRLFCPSEITVITLRK